MKEESNCNLNKDSTPRQKEVERMGKYGALAKWWVRVITLSVCSRMQPQWDEGWVNKGGWGEDQGRDGVGSRLRSL